MSDLSGSSKDNDWAYLSKKLVERTFEPAAHFPFVVYVFTGILLFGGLGIWAELLKIVIADCPPDFNGLITAILTFFPALIGSTTLQLVLASTNRSDKVLISFALLILCIFLAFAVLLPFFSETHPVGVIAIGIACSVCAVWMWWFTNGDEPTFRKTPDPDAATGGTTDRALSGDLSQVRV